MCDPLWSMESRPHPKVCRFSLSSRPTCIPPPSLRAGAKTWWEARHIVNVEKDDKGRLLWTIAWDGVDERGKAWKDTKEPTRNVNEALRAEWKAKQKQKAAAPRLSVDVSALEEMVQRVAGNAVMRESGENGFGEVHTTEIGALGLLDLAEHYINGVAARYGLPIHKRWDPKDKVTTHEVCILDAEQIAEFLAFEKLVPRRTGARSWRVSRRGHDLRIVGVVKLRYFDNKHLKGTVTFESEVQTVYINGASGNLVIPHIHNPLEPLKSNAFLAQVRACVDLAEPVLAGLPQQPPAPRLRKRRVEAEYFLLTAIRRRRLGRHLLEVQCRNPRSYFSGSAAVRRLTA